MRCLNKLINNATFANTLQLLSIINQVINKSIADKFNSQSIIGIIKHKFPRKL